MFTFICQLNECDHPHHWSLRGKRERQCSGLFPLHNNGALSWFGHLTVGYLSVNAHLLNSGTQRTFGCPRVSPSAPSVGGWSGPLAKEGAIGVGAKGNCCGSGMMSRAVNVCVHVVSVLVSQRVDSWSCNGPEWNSVGHLE